MAAYARRNPYTDLWMNLSPCASCLKALKKGGKHRAHKCDGGQVYGSAYGFCDCECQAMTSRGVEALSNVDMSLATGWHYV